MSEELKMFMDVLPFLIPLFVIQIALLVVAFLDLIKRERVRGGNKIIWALVIVLISIIGPVIYLFAGRLESSVGSD